MVGERVKIYFKKKPVRNFKDERRGYPELAINYNKYNGRFTDILLRSLRRNDLVIFGKHGRVIIRNISRSRLGFSNFFDGKQFAISEHSNCWNNANF